MGFGAALALAVGLLVALPIVAHMLRKRTVEERPFPPARIVLRATAVARRRSSVEDRGLLGLRALAVLLLAVLGATPFVSCSRLALGRADGASVALVLVVDDSMSMQAQVGGASRLDRAREAAGELLGALRAGDGIAVVTAGKPARVLLAGTDDRDLALRTVREIRPTDRGTDLDGALALARALAAGLPQADKRLVVLSDLSDASAVTLAAPLAEGMRLSAPLAELRGRLPDCGVVRATRRGREVTVRVACGAEADAAGRNLEVRRDGSVVAFAPLRRAREAEVSLALPPDLPEGALSVQLSGTDAITVDDRAPVVVEAGLLEIAVLADVAQSGLVTGGGTAVEEALSALDETVALRPMVAVPDGHEALASYGALVLDDPPGLTPEARAAVKTWVERGGVAVLFLGPRAGQAILGAAFEPFFSGPVRWQRPAPRGADLARSPGFGESAGGLSDLAPKGRALLEGRAASGARLLAAWTDGQPLAFSRELGAGTVTVVTLPSSPEESDLALRPAFLDLLAQTIDAARARKVGQRGAAGARWRVPSGAKVTGPEGEVLVRDVDGRPGIVPERAGLYVVRSGTATEARVAEIDPHETDLTPRPFADAAPTAAGVAAAGRVDVSREMALVVLGALVLESVLRLVGRRRVAPVT